MNNLKYNENATIATDRHTVKLPLRVNWGGWSDTPPYCNEHGGTILNMAILLNGEKPVEVTLEKIPERKIVFDSQDMSVHGERLAGSGGRSDTGTEVYYFHTGNRTEDQSMQHQSEQPHERGTE